MADLASTIAGALQQAGLHDPQMIASITQSVMGQMTQPQQPGGPGWGGQAPSAQYGYQGQPDRDLLASQSYGRGPAPASLDPREPQQMAQDIAAEQSPAAGVGSAMGAGAQSQLPGGWQPFTPPVDRADARSGLPFVTPKAKSKGGLLKKAPALSDADRLNWQQVMALNPGAVPPAIRSLLSSGA